MNLGLDVTGAKQLQRQFAAAGKQVQRTAIRKALVAAAAILRKAAREAAPVRTGTLRKAIQTRVISRRSRREAHLFVTRGKEAKHDAWYWHFVEFGTQRLRARPFARPAFDRHEDAIVDEYRDRLDEVLRELR